MQNINFYLVLPLIFYIIGLILCIHALWHTHHMLHTFVRLFLVSNLLLVIYTVCGFFPTPSIFLGVLNVFIALFILLTLVELYRMIIKVFNKKNKSLN